MTITEYRGVRNMVYAEVTEDSFDNFTTGEVKELAGVSEISKTTESSQETHYYDNTPAIVVSSNGADEITINASALDLETLAEITGQTYLDKMGAMVEHERTPKYFALGYVTKKTDGTEMYVWRLKGTFAVPDSTHITEDDGTDANGQELTYTGISTTHKYEINGKQMGVKAVNVDTSVNSFVNDTNFFQDVVTPDNIPAPPV